MIYSKKTTLGRTGLLVGRLGISSSFGALATAFEEAFSMFSIFAAMPPTAARKPMYFHISTAKTAPALSVSPP